MKLADLLKVLDSATTAPGPVPDREVHDITDDSRKVVPGSLFVAVRGFNSDGHRFIPQAVAQGAIAVVAEENAGAEGLGNAQVVLVPDSRAALARIAAAYYGHPSQRLKLVGITGTKGKTTTSYLVRSIIEASGGSTGLIGTIDYRVGKKVYPAPNTTPGALDLQRLLAEMAHDGAGYCVMEVSSHALALGRIDGCVFETAVFTNLAQDHLDFHRDMESYFQAKLLLFTALGKGRSAVVNADDPASREIIGKTAAAVYTYGMSERADIRPAGEIGHGIGGLSFSAQTPEGPVPVESSLVGRHNVYNILAAIGAGLAQGFSADVIAQGISNMRAVPGRMEKVEEGQPFGVIVDYAHTEDSLAALLTAVRDVTKGRIITVFGCGGDRDRTKRPKMGAAAARGSDLAIVTTDNPRTEDPSVIIREIEAGMTTGAVRVSTFVGARKDLSGKMPYRVIPDRREAITEALGAAGPGDVVVLAGKGHEDYQLVGDRKLHFDDREVAREEIRKSMYERI
jgi:UDP-N-acetylmuramoyl-L-alanyl-D-glutamate--2,6-diaminopimelate ligase